MPSAIRQPGTGIKRFGAARALRLEVSLSADRFGQVEASIEAA
jgi:hypothetical protein